ncbi:MAG TPA: peptide chain release factor N(5)-glutamine methyltransferase [Ktedonobacteraceae bacterium]|nr:peptide chain release factor N(5)-glutamine methyltransferase [Ktedonobacteraceae bacterium]
MMTVRDALEQGIRLLTEKHSQTDDHAGWSDHSGIRIDPARDHPEAEDRLARLDAQLLLSHVLNVERSLLFAYPQDKLSHEQEQQFLALIGRRKKGEPVAYLIGHQEFYGLDFLVDKRVLIPRPETELLVEQALQVCRSMLAGGRTPIVADIGTGSGAIPVAIAVEEPGLPYLYASDISQDALAVASLNCRRHHVEDRVRLLYGDLLTPLPEPVDVVIANLPYVGTEEIGTLQADVRDYEPQLALFSGPEGLDLLRRFMAEAQQSNKLKHGAVLLLEIGYRQREPLARLLEELWPQARVTFRKDFANWDRVLQVEV